LAILQLYEKGKLELDEPVSKYVDKHLLNEGITIRQLLSHTSGFSNPLPKWIHYPDDHESFEHEKFADSILNKYSKPAYEPGTKAKYSNLGYLLLGQVVQKVSGQPYEQYIMDNIVLKIKNIHPSVGFLIPEQDILVRGHQKSFTLMSFVYKMIFGKKLYAEKAGKWQVFNDFYLNGPSYGGLIMNAQSLANYANTLYFQSNVFLSKDTKSEMFEPAKLKNGKTASSNLMGFKVDFCLAWMKSDLEGKSYYGHSGGGGGYSCDMHIYPEDGIVTVIMMNRTAVPKDLKLLNKIDKMIFQ